MNKKIIAIIITAGLIGGFFGSLAASDLARASVLDNIWNFITGSNATSTPLTAPAKAVTPYAPTIDYEQAIISAVEKASPSVVSVVISKDLPVIEQCPYSPWSNLPPEFQQFFGGDNPQFTQPCDTGKTQRQEVGGGSGFIISSDGMILTNKHVVSDTSADYTVLTNDGKKYDAKVLARDPAQDLAVLKIDANDLPVVSLGDSDSIKLGQTAIAIGNALGEFRNTVSVGAISGLYRSITASGGSFGSESLQNLIQTDAAINPGNSGGPLLNLKGEVVGIDTAVASDAQNIGFAIPINQAKRDIQSVKATGSIKIPYLGVRYIAVTSDVVKSQKLSVDHGALVRGSQDGPAVIKGSPADKAGVQAEDIILEVNGVKVDENNALTNLVQRYNIGDTITLKIQRGDKTLDIPVTLTERPANQ
jgi:serine protease Do